MSLNCCTRDYVVNYDYNFALGGLDTVTVYCADQFYLLSQTYLDEFNPSAETSGARIETVLDLPEVDFPALARDISTGTVNLGHDASYTVPAGTNVLQYIAQINDTAEFGRLFMSREGVLTFQDRIGARCRHLLLTSMTTAQNTSTTALASHLRLTL
jgi:hypothetical protein